MLFKGYTILTDLELDIAEENDSEVEVFRSIEDFIKEYGEYVEYNTIEFEDYEDIELN
jgi:hypothetical protein